MTAPRSEIAHDLEPLAGTAAVTVGFLLLEHGGPWTAPAGPSLPDGARTAIETACTAADLTPMLIRRPGHEGEVDQPMLVLSVPDHGGLAISRRLTHVGEMTELDLPEIARAARAGEVSQGWEASAPVLVVCTHAPSDASGARHGEALAAALAELAPLQAWECSHPGGHHLGHDVVVLPTGLVYGRIEPELVPALLAAVAEGRVQVDHLRGRSHLTAPLQVSEVALRRAARAADDRAVRLVASDTSDLPGAPGLRTTSVWQVSGESWRVVVDSTPGGASRPTGSVGDEEPAPDVHTIVEVTAADGPGRGARAWDERYREADGPREPHPAVVETATGHAPGSVLDLACGTGRHSLWLAENGWDVTALDFSRVGIETLRRAATERDLRIDAQVGDARAWSPPGGARYDLVLMSFVHLPGVLTRATRWVAPGGRLLVVGHSASTPSGVGPSDPRLRLDRIDLAARVTGARMRVLRAAEVRRETADGTTTDVVVLAVRP